MGEIIHLNIIGTHSFKTPFIVLNSYKAKKQMTLAFTIPFQTDVMQSAVSFQNS